jgi:hypothetical protein
MREGSRVGALAHSILVALQTAHPRAPIFVTLQTAHLAHLSDQPVHGSISRRFAEMGVTIPKAYTKRDEWERDLMDRAHQAVPLGRHTDEETGAAPGVGEGHAQEGGGTPAQFLDERGDGYKGDTSRRRLTCANVMERRPGMSLHLGLAKSAKEGTSRWLAKDISHSSRCTGT